MFYYEIEFVGCDPSDAVTALIEKKLRKLQQFFDRITAAYVTIRVPHHRGNRPFFHVHIHLDVPGRSIVVNREPERNEEHMDIGIAVRDAFDKATRQLEDHARVIKDFSVRASP